MFGVIQLSEVVFGAHVLSLTAAKASLSDVKASLSSHQSSSKVLDLYQAEFEALSQLVAAYARLLEKDIALIAEAGQELALTDKQLGQAIGFRLQ
ncbi:TPA: TIGR04197 family type VII secretion effector [Streptococcus equi subsp. zooepidemicus]|nr:TIGR04197 family type VII secretion effector [Streptococcus equi subsp. zooepidemicus]